MYIILYKILKPYIPQVTRKVIDQLLRDNDRLQQEWLTRYQAMEREMWYYRDRLEELVLGGRDEEKH